MMPRSVIRGGAVAWLVFKGFAINVGMGCDDMGDMCVQCVKIGKGGWWSFG